MEIKELVANAHDNAVKKGFHSLEASIISKIFRNAALTDEECNAVINAFKSQQLILLISEAAEAMEALRKNDDENFKEEIADIAIRIGDLSGNYDIDLSKEIIKKMEINKNRQYKHGKSF